VYTHRESEYLPLGYVEGLGGKKETKITRIEKKSTGCGCYYFGGLAVNDGKTEWRERGDS
jgi:hypothetical protein